MEQLILVRHGETTHNAQGIAQGWQDSALSDIGREQVMMLARRIPSFKPDALYTSPLPRAMTTAEAIRETTGLEIQVLEELREMNYGGWEGRSFLDVRKKEEAHYRRWIEDPAFACPDGESHNDVLARMNRAFELVRVAKRPVVVTHGTAIRIGATALLGAPVSMSRHLAQDNASINLFVWRGGRCVLKVWNDTTHCAKDER
jgi:broad specificity phosphatase PhoE